jgi:hypothetical protein
VISDATIKSFQEVIESEYQVVLDEKEAREILTNWVGYFDLLAKIDHREQSENQGSLASPLNKTGY